jgi:CRISPR-associated helicase Cas3/CRISPR-associated endonuclease Cas3-HD
MPSPARTSVDDAGFLAHSANAEGAGVPELLAEHLRRVAQRSRLFAAAFGAEEQAQAAGLLHDLGKYADQFQRRLRDRGEPGRDHWTIGALALSTSGSLGLIPAFAAAGHHTGLALLPTGATAYWRELSKVLGDPRCRAEFTDTNGTLLRRRFLADGFPWPEITHGLRAAGRFAADMLDVRMIYSALVDADYLATEGHFNGDAQTPYRPREEGPVLDLDRALAALDFYVAEVRRSRGDDPMAAVRDALYGRCCEAAEGAQGLFTLSAPTGAGKTLAMLAFALRHARRRGLRRIVLVMPFLNIIDQTAEVYRSIFSPAHGFDPNSVLEHHSLANGRESRAEEQEDEDADFSRLLTENWDAPVILTTTVQFFESLMAARPSRCRKLHRLARSVILFDEAQTLPAGLAAATLATLSRFVEPGGPYGSTVLFATATQPAFDAFDERLRSRHLAQGWRPTEIVTDAEGLYATAAARVHVTWRHQAVVELDDLASELARHKRVLCIVNLKRHAAHLASTLRERGVEGLLHLSTNLCPAHRGVVLDDVRHRLRDGLPVRLVSTQCVEAGVDLDFPVVYRALAPMEAIAQAAGRCNRHGRDQIGRVVVFKPRDERGLYPPGYTAAVNATEIFLESLAQQAELDYTEIIHSPARLRQYYDQLYALTGRAATELDDERPLLEAIRAGDFPEVAKLYRLIAQDAINVLVLYNRARFAQLRDEITEAPRLTPELIRGWLRRASPHAISLYRPGEDAEIWRHLEPVQFSRRHEADSRSADWFIALPGLEYDTLTGVSGRGTENWIV